MRAIELFSELLLDSPLHNFPLESLCRRLDCEAATLWRTSERDRDEFVLFSHYNRPDLDGADHHKTFLLRAADPSFLSLSRSQSVLILNRDEVRLMFWENKDLHGYTYGYFEFSVFLFLFSEDGTSLGLLSFYYLDKVDNFWTTDDAQIFATSLSDLIYLLEREDRKFSIERKKIGHEIAQLLRNSLRRIERIQKGPQFHSNRTLTDVYEAIRTAISTSENESFIEGVHLRQKTATLNDLASLISTTTHQAIAGFSKERVALNSVVMRDGHVNILMSNTDLELSLSNLFSNAAKYSLPGSTVSSYVKRDHGCAVLVISNLSDELSEDDFEKVWRFGARGSNVAFAPGNGIGLAVVDDICTVYDISRKLRQFRSPQGFMTEVELKFPRSICKWKVS